MPVTTSRTVAPPAPPVVRMSDVSIGYGERTVVRHADLTVRDGEVVADDFAPAEIQWDGRTLPLRGAERAAAREKWEVLRSCTDLRAEPRPQPADAR